MNALQRAALQVARVPGASPLDIEEAERRYAKADSDFIAAQTRALAAMGALRPGAGSTRARSTTANARWASAAEQRDRVQERLRREFVEALAFAPPRLVARARRPARSLSAMLQAQLDKARR